MSKEIRYLQSKVEIRTDQSESEYIEGYALKFEKWSERMGILTPFREIISRDSLIDTNMADVVALFNHREDFPLARSTVSGENGRLELTVDDIGLKFRLTPTNTTFARDLLENVRAGVVDQCSFAFSIDHSSKDAETWTYNDNDEIYERRINKIKNLYDISVVTYPAYPDTEAIVSSRSRERVKELELKRSLPTEREKILMELDLLSV
ncbi:HK97 family phage prohead protease [Thermoactinomyces sp. DSM 45892]|uniref:HK97 family phage prohead protease n=1 Tax=Thermoactinomyces sp. DSM 45892 TaxID=1882753 RepID=UPI000B87545B|nr:HK97 family phage prohead protease [Thermoactinomyces sp. DSM 45892]